MVGLGMLRPPRHTGRESSSLSTSLIAVLPVMSGMRRCQIASNKGCRELVRWGMVRVKYVHLLVKQCVCEA